MHALHYPHLPRAVTVTLIAAVLAIGLPLGLATSLNDMASTPASTGTVSTAPVLRAPGTSPAWLLSPFARLLPSPVVVPWATTRP